MTIPFRPQRLLLHQVPSPRATPMAVSLRETPSFLQLRAEHVDCTGPKEFKQSEIKRKTCFSSHGEYCINQIGCLFSC